jgi:Fic family protein
MLYNWQLPDWPEFRYDLGDLEATLLAFVEKAGEVSGIFTSLGGGHSTRYEINLVPTNRI